VTLLIDGRMVDDPLLSEAQAWLRARVDDGAHCPCCKQFAKVYKRRINARQALALITLWRACGQDWGHVPSIDKRLAGDGGMIAYLRWWGLIEESQERRADGGRAGWWRITDQGGSFVRGVKSVPKYAHIYDGSCLRFSGDMVTIRDALGAKFDYDKLMRGDA
jgi:hypothetical protein